MASRFASKSLRAARRSSPSRPRAGRAETPQALTTRSRERNPAGEGQRLRPILGGGGAETEVGREEAVEMIGGHLEGGGINAPIIGGGGQAPLDRLADRHILFLHPVARGDA